MKATENEKQKLKNRKLKDKSRGKETLEDNCPAARSPALRVVVSGQWPENRLQATLRTIESPGHWLLATGRYKCQ
jgi:hypothetical protein